jgi:16S rRNA processing protein RimM
MGGAQTAAGFVPVAEIVRPVGLRGEVKLYPLIDWHPPLLGSRFLVWESGKPAEVSISRSGSDGLVVRPAGCADRTAAEALVGRQLGFRREAYGRPGFPRPAAGLPFRLVGRAVVTSAGQDLGTVDEVRRHGTQLTLVILRGEEELLVPAVAPILREEDGEQGPLTIDPPEGLLDVGNAAEH